MKHLSMILAMLGVIGSLAATPANAASSFPAVTEGNAHGALITLKSGPATKVIAGPIAPANLDCNTVSSTNSNTVGNIGLGNSVTSGTVDDTVTSMHSPGHASIQSVSVVQGVSVLGGAITAQAIHAVATSMGNQSGASSNADGSSFANLVVLGVPINVTPGPNTMILLPGIGSVTLNEEFSSTSDPAITTVTVNMVHVFVTMRNSLGLRVGTEIIVGHAKSSLELLTAPSTVQANSYGLLANGFAGHIHAQSGPFAPAAIGCGPGNATDQILSISSPVGNTGEVTDKAMGNVTNAGSMAGAESDIASVSLLNALISADSIDAIANAQRSNSGGQNSGSLTLVNAKIAGMSIAANPAPNTRINIANLGYAIVNEQIGHANRNSASETVNGIHLFVTMANSFNLPIGATITIAHAHAATNGF